MTGITAQAAGIRTGKKISGKLGMFFLAVIIFFQIIAMMIVCSGKKEYHIDEIYSYLLSNSYHTDRIANDETKWDKWVSGDQYESFITVQDGEKFAYDKVYYNNSLDCHPPLYYWVIHTVCSFFPDQFSKWFGLVVNILFLIGVDILIYQISRRMITSKLMQLLPVVVYGFSPIAVETVTFIRMYMMLTFISLMVCYLTISLMKEGITKTKIGLIWLFIFLGGITQYYSLVLSFWGVLFFEIYLLTQKKIKLFFIHGFGSLLSVVLVYFSFPFILTQAFGSDTNNIGNEVSNNFFNIRLHLRQARDLAETLIDHTGYGNAGNRLCIALGVVIAVLLVLKIIKNKKSALKQTPEALWMAGVFAATFLSVSFIGGEYVYLRYIYYIVPLMYILAAYLLDKYAGSKGLIQKILIVALTVYSVSAFVYGTVNRMSPYLFRETSESDEVLSEYSNCKLLIIGTEDERSTAVPTGNLTKIMKFNDVYLGTKNSIKESGSFEECLNNEDQFVVFIGTSDDWLDGMDPYQTIKELSGGQKVTYISLTEGTLGEYYLVKKRT